MLMTHCVSGCRIPAVRSRVKETINRSLPVAISLAAVCLQLSATTLPYKSFDDLIKESDAVVAGRVAAVESQYNAQKEIYTFVTFDQLNVLGGSYQDSTLTIRLKGGQIGNDTSHIIGSPEFKVQDQVVLFLQGNGRSMVPLVGWTQGVFRIVPDPATQQQVINDADGNRVLGLQSGQVLREQIVRPEAQILSPQTGSATSQSQAQGSAGAPDDTRSSSASMTSNAVQENLLRTLPTMTSRAFLDTVKQAASAKQGRGQLSSVRLMDFTVASANMDASIGPKVQANATAAQQSPVQPQRKAVPPVKDQQ